MYVMTNEAMPGLVKIGRTARCPKLRATELHQTGVPFPFEVHFSVISPDCDDLERYVHKELADCRVNDQREFFLCDVGIAIRTIKEVHREQVENWLDLYLPDHGIHGEGMGLCPSHPHTISTYFDLSPSEIVDAYAFLYPEDVAPAIKRMQDHQSGKERMKSLCPLYEVSDK